MVERNWLSAICSFLLSLMLWVGSSCQPANSKPSLSGAGNDRGSTGGSGAAPKSKMNNNASQTRTEVTGTWGGDHISMEVTEGGAELQYDCAHGAITEKIVPDRDGKFAVKGTHSREHPGPTRNGEAANSEPVLYRGIINGETMELTVTLAGSNDVLGTFSLAHGKQGRLRRCG